MADIAQIKMTDGTTYDLKDGGARTRLDMTGIPHDLNTDDNDLDQLMAAFNSLVKKLGGIACFAALAFGAQADVVEPLTCKWGKVKGNPDTVTNLVPWVESRYTDATNRIESVRSSVNTEPCWSKAGAWGIEFKLSSSSSSQTIVGTYENDCGQIYNVLQSHHVRNLEADCWGELYDEYSIEALSVSGWRCLTAGGSVSSNGHLTANASGIYVVSAMNQYGEIKYAEVPISNGTQDTIDETLYWADHEGSARKAVNDEALAWINAAPNHGPGIVGTEETWYKWGYFTQPAWAATSAGHVGNDKPFALGTKLLVGATHYPDWCKWEGFQTIGSTTVKKGEWVRLDKWAVSNGWNAAQIAAMNIDDISMVTILEGEIPLADCPYLMSEAKMKEQFVKLQGVQCWCATQAFADPMQLVYSSVRGDGSTWKFDMGCADSRNDIATKLKTMGVAYPIHSGDSGHPIYFHHDGKWIVTSLFTYAGSGPSFVKALPVIKAYAASVGCQLNLYE